MGQQPLPPHQQQQAQYGGGFNQQGQRLMTPPNQYGGARPPPGGPGPAQPSRSKIDPNQIPSPIVVQEADQQNYETTPYSTFSRMLPPLASTRFRAVDEG
jgi:protein transport protein SEC24